MVAQGLSPAFDVEVKSWERAGGEVLDSVLKVGAKRLSRRVTLPEVNYDMVPRERDVRGAVFAIKSHISQLRAHVQLTGYLDMETVPQLRVFLDQMTQDMAAGVVRDFEFDISLLYLMSSSSISCFAAWIKHTKDAFPASRVKFCTNPSLVWQSRALIPIRRLAEDIVSIA